MRLTALQPERHHYGMRRRQRLSRAVRLTSSRSYFSTLSMPGNREPGITARFFLLSVAFIAIDDSVALDSDLGVKFGGLVIAPPLLKDLILPSERG
jgi:hypothetical protein